MEGIINVRLWNTAGEDDKFSLADGERVRLGKGKGCDLATEVSSIYQCVIFREGNDIYVQDGDGERDPREYRNYGSDATTRLNGRILSFVREFPLKHGDELGFGLHGRYKVNVEILRGT